MRPGQKDRQAFTGKLDVAFGKAEGGGVRAKTGKIGVAFDRLDLDTHAGELTIDTDMDALDAPVALLEKVIYAASDRFVMGALRRLVDAVETKLSPTASDERAVIAKLRRAFGATDAREAR